MLCASLSHPAWDRLPQPEPSDLPEKNFMPGESMEEFFARRARRCEMLEARETEKKRSTRLNWVFEANKGHRLKHSKLYEWHHVVQGDRTSPLTQSVVETGFEEETFFEYTTKQRRYCGFHDEWDLHVGFAPGERGLGLDNLDWDDAGILEIDKDYYPPPPQAEPSTHAPSEERVPEVSIRKLRQFDSKSFAPHFLQTMYLRFGFVLPPGYVYYPKNPRILGLLDDFKLVTRSVSFNES